MLLVFFGFCGFCGFWLLLAHVAFTALRSWLLFFVNCWVMWLLFVPGGIFVFVTYDGLRDHMSTTS